MTIGTGKWGAALFISAAIHTGVAGWLYQSDDEAKIVGGSPVEISLLGDAFQNEKLAGDPSEIFEPVEQKVFDTIETETSEHPEEVITETSVEVTKVEVVEPFATPTMVDVVKVIETNQTKPIHQTPSEPITTADVEPSELLSAEIQLADINIASLQPTSLSAKTTSQPLLELKPITVEPDEVKPENSEAEIISPTVERIEPQKTELTVKPEKEQASKKPIRKKKKAKKKPSSGSKGKGNKNTRAGDSKGSKTAKKNAVGKSKGRKSSRNGNASASNYKGKVRRKVKRSFRRPRSGSRPRKDAVVRFVLSTSGNVRSVRLVRSSGSKKLDQAALSAVRRASPFPKPPGSMRGASLNFTLPFGT